MRHLAISLIFGAMLATNASAKDKNVDGPASISYATYITYVAESCNQFFIVDSAKATAVAKIGIGLALKEMDGETMMAMSDYFIRKYKYEARAYSVKDWCIRQKALTDASGLHILK